MTKKTPTTTKFAKPKGAEARTRSQPEDKETTRRVRRRLMNIARGRTISGSTLYPFMDAYYRLGALEFMPVSTDIEKVLSKGIQRKLRDLPKDVPTTINFGTPRTANSGVIVIWPSDDVRAYMLIPKSSLMYENATK
jgi:hypothetical protein